MLCRSTAIVHPGSGVTMMTPLLIPSFSSKGFGTSKGDGTSEIAKIMEVAAQFIEDTCLVSAYDVGHGHLASAAAMPVKPELMFVDSGGYEISSDRDYSTVIETLPERRKWNVEMYVDVLKKWPEERPAVFVSFDQPNTRVQVREQIEQARDLFKVDNRHLHLFLLKPETKGQDTLEKALNSLNVTVEDLRSFGIVGVTEKELGSKMLDRMKRIAKLRLALDTAKINAPIHVFGAMDPLSVMLYFVAGAEIFDGLTWLRYGYHNGVSVYTHNWGVLNFDVQTRDSEIRSKVLAHNLYQLKKLQMSMRTFARTRVFDQLAWHGDVVKAAWETLSTEMGLEA